MAGISALQRDHKIQLKEKGPHPNSSGRAIRSSATRFQKSRTFRENRDLPTAVSEQGLQVSETKSVGTGRRHAASRPRTFNAESGRFAKRALPAITACLAAREPEVPSSAPKSARKRSNVSLRTPTLSPQKRERPCRCCNTSFETKVAAVRSNVAPCGRSNFGKRTLTSDPALCVDHNNQRKKN